MKTLKFLTLAIALLITGDLFAQTLRVSTYAEQTKMGTKIGTAVGIALPHNFVVGTFYQHSMQKLVAEPFRPLMEENEFFGVFMSGNLYQNNKLALDAIVRTGITNRENFAITPSIQGTYKITRIIELNAGFGVRCFNPTLVTGLTFKFN